MILMNVLLLLALAGTILGMVAARTPTGPEGIFGIWILFLIPSLCLALLLIILIARGRLSFIPGGGTVRTAAVVGAWITFSLLLMVTEPHDNPLINGLLTAAPYLVLAGCAATINHSRLPNPRHGRWIATILLGGTSVVGWGLAGTGAVTLMKNEIERSAVRMQEERARKDERQQWEIAEFAKLDHSAPLHRLLPFVWARNREVERQAGERVASFPDLDDKLIELIGYDNKDAITYIAKFHNNPPARFAPAWGNMLERQRGKWSTLQFDEYAGNKELNLRNYFLGAQRIQLAGGSLYPELKAWHEYLQKCRGLGNLAAFVERLLRVESDAAGSGEGEEP